MSLFDSIRITLSADREPLSAVMDRAFSKTDFMWSVGLHDEVFLDQERFVDTNLTATTVDTAKKKRPVDVEVTETQDQNAAIPERMKLKTNFTR